MAVLLLIVAGVGLLLSLVVQLGESIRDQNSLRASTTYRMRDLALILGAPGIALLCLTVACVLSRWRLLIVLAVPVAVLCLYHIYLALSRL